MNRKCAAITAGSLSLLAILIGGLGWSFKYEPTFYGTALAETAPPEVRREQAKVFVQTTLQLVDEIRNEDSWSHEFSEEAVNGWLAEELPVKYGELLPPEVTSPRVKFEAGKLLVAFQVRHGMWKGIVSGTVHPWVAGPNQLALEFQSVRIGLIPVPVDEILGDFVTQMNGAGWRMRWQASARKDVLVVDLDDDLSLGGEGQRPVLEAVDLEARMLRITGRRGLEAAETPRVADRPPSAQ
jgi:hypothetical protein